MYKLVMFTIFYSQVNVKTNILHLRLTSHKFVMYHLLLLFLSMYIPIFVQFTNLQIVA